MRIILILCISLFVGNITGQKLDHRLGYMIIQSKKPSDLADALDDQSGRYRSPIRVEKTLSKRMGIFLVTFDHSRVHERKLLDDLRHDRRILVAQYDHIPAMRAIPNDSQFFNQWHWVNNGQTGGITDADTDAERAWDIGTGGVTARGDTIVVAIVDDGLGYIHEDIATNAWVNRGEIPDNGIDDDENGYTDDIHGWNVYSDSPDILFEGHGLNVSGVVGAVGNNGVGITGMNWNVKLMGIVGGTPESAAIASYAYALEQRILYNETDGQKGAFVVATNSSWGIDFGQPADAPLWCAFYDSLGVHGILSAAATSNVTYNVDELGDLPTACPSEFLLSVTAVNHYNERNFSAFGLEHVDFGAPGVDVFTTTFNNNYGVATGTSFASPVAAGLVALLYSAPCLAVADLAHENPEAGARYIRDLIFNGVEPDPVLASETKFGGTLNAGNSMELLMALCSECPIPFSISTEPVSPFEVLVDWVTTDTADAINARYKPAAAPDWDTIENVTQPLLLSNLLACTLYEIQFESICADTSTGFQLSHTFITEGCCELPEDIQVIANGTSFQATWSEVFAASYFLIQWRPQGEDEWIEEVTSLQQVTIEHLLPCTFYEFRLQTNCDTSETGFSQVITFRTLECGNCIDLPYCESFSNNSSEEFIDSLIIGPLVNHSGNNGGYTFFEELSPEYIAGASYEVWMRPGFGFQGKFDEQFRIWLDDNQDGEFDDTELLLDTVLSSEDTFVLDEILIPFDALKGNTRMRVSMAYFEVPNNMDQLPCGSIPFGEVEDYCVNILRNDDACPEVDTVRFDGITFTSAFMYWPSAEGAIAYTYRFRETGELEYTELATVDTTAVLADLKKCSTFEIQIRTVCLFDTTSYETTYLLTTDCDVAVEDIHSIADVFEVYPNPADQYTTVRFIPAETGQYQLSLFNTQGIHLKSQSTYADKGMDTEIDLYELDKLTTGMYFIVLEKDGHSLIKKLIKI